MYLLIKSAGIAEPRPVAATFAFRHDDGSSLSAVVRLDTMVMVVDAINLLRHFASHDFLTDQGERLREEDTRMMVNLMAKLIEFADVVVLNKASDEGPDRTDAPRQIIKARSPEMPSISCRRSQT